MLTHQVGHKFETQFKIDAGTVSPSLSQSSELLNLILNSALHPDAPLPGLNTPMDHAMVALANCQLTKDEADSDFNVSAAAAHFSLGAALGSAPSISQFPRTFQPSKLEVATSDRQRLNGRSGGIILEEPA